MEDSPRRRILLAFALIAALILLAAGAALRPFLHRGTPKQTPPPLLDKLKLDWQAQSRAVPRVAAEGTAPSLGGAIEAAPALSREFVPAPPSTPSRTGPPARPAGPAPEALDDKALRAKLGKWDEDEARRMITPAVMLAALDKVLAHPALARALLDNKLVVSSFMKGALRQPHCQSASALKDFLLDSKKPDGIRMYLQGLDSALGQPGALDSILQSGTATAAMSGCPAFAALSQDGTLLSQALMGNPDLRRLAFDPRLITALTRQPEAAKLYSNVQASGGALGGPSP